MGLAFAVFTPFLTHNRGHLFRFLLFLQLFVVFLSGTFTGFTDTLFLLEFLFSLLLLHILNSVETLNESSHLTLLLTLQQFGDL